MSFRIGQGTEFSIYACVGALAEARSAVCDGCHVGVDSVADVDLRGVLCVYFYVQRTCFARVHNGAVRKAKVVRLKASSALLFVYIPRRIK